MAKPAPERVFNALSDAVKSEVWDPGKVMLDMRLPAAERAVVDATLNSQGLVTAERSVIHAWSNVKHDVTVVERDGQTVVYLLHVDFRVVDKPTQANIDAVSRIPQLVPAGSRMRIFTGQVSPHLSFVRMVSDWRNRELDAQFVNGRNLIDFSETGGDIATFWTVLGFSEPPAPNGSLVVGVSVQPAATPAPAEAAAESGGPSVFVSYSHKDTAVFVRLQVHLEGLVHSDADIDIWTDERIAPSDDWRAEISAALDDADFLVLLVSADFLASKFVKDEELPLLEKASERGLKVFWLKAQPGFVPRKITRFQALHKSPPLGKMSEGDMESALEQAIEKLANLLEADE